MKVFTAYHTDKKFPAFSLTGQECRQQCKHCQGRFLKGMIPVTSEYIYRVQKDSCSVEDVMKMAEFRSCRFLMQLKK